MICENCGCGTQAEDFDSFCEEHQRCFICGDRDSCNCKEECKALSVCCEEKFIPETDFCSRCKEHSSSLYQYYIEELNNELKKTNYEK